jgi:hypothetical protein
MANDYIYGNTAALLGGLLVSLEEGSDDGLPLGVATQ